MHVDVSDQDVRIHDWISVPWGVVSLTEHAPLPDDSLAGRQAAYAHMRRVTREAFAAFAARAERFAGEPLRLLGTSGPVTTLRSEEHTSELQSLMRISYAVFCLKKKTKKYKQKIRSILYK